MTSEPAFAALSDPTRRRLFELIRESPQAVGQLAGLLPVSRPAVSQHLRVLMGAGLVEVEQQGTRHIYRVDPSGLLSLRAWVDKYWEDTLDAFEDAARKEHAMMQTRDKIAPVVKRRIIPILVDRAFDLFTHRIEEWWPLASHSIAGADVIEIRFDERVGGRVTEIASDGTEYVWADVLQWNPPHRFVLSWHPNPEPVAASTLEVRFLPTGDGGTEIILEHWGWEEFGDAGESLRQDYESGWDLVLGPLEAAAKTG